MKLILGFKPKNASAHPSGMPDNHETACRFPRLADEVSCEARAEDRDDLDRDCDAVGVVRDFKSLRAWPHRRHGGDKSYT